LRDAVSAGACPACPPSQAWGPWVCRQRRALGAPQYRTGAAFRSTHRYLCHHKKEREEEEKKKEKEKKKGRRRRREMEKGWRSTWGGEQRMSALSERCGVQCYMLICSVPQNTECPCKKAGACWARMLCTRLSCSCWGGAFPSCIVYASQVQTFFWKLVPGQEEPCSGPPPPCTPCAAPWAEGVQRSQASGQGLRLEVEEVQGVPVPPRPRRGRGRFPQLLSLSASGGPGSGCWSPHPDHKQQQKKNVRERGERRGC